MKTLIVENTWLTGISHGWGNGYVILPVGHKYHGVDYDEIFVDVHGGLTYAAVIGDEEIERYNLSSEDLGSWMIGFDTCHLDDTPYNWSKQAVDAETIRLLEQLK